ncbi:homocysteine S-methyltransferase family protein [Marinobacterium sp. YM272]|uniref:homocysteine S-methyltransferase family protein n=1 Tax=Marinobacterium sp. YM272 TaxID=3421654 RepID=UPI003D7FF732
MSNIDQLSAKLFLTDGGAETTLVFHEGFELPYFAAFPLLDTAPGRAALDAYYRKYLAIAIKARTGFILESATWRAHQDYTEKLGYDRREADRVNRDAIKMLKALREQYETPDSPILISGCVGPRGDAYQPGHCMTPDEAERYHRAQIESLASAGADMVSAFTMNYAEETIGFARAARAVGIPSVISFTTETDGRLPSGEALSDAIKRVDAETDSAPVYYMINCAHPDHFTSALEKGEAWIKRIKGIRANASRLSHAELDESEELDSGNPEELGQLYRALRDRFPQFTVLGGCCGTDERHIEQICHCCAPRTCA